MLLEDGIRGGLVLGRHAYVITPPRTLRGQTHDAAMEMLEPWHLKATGSVSAERARDASRDPLRRRVLPNSLGQVHRCTKQVVLALLDSRRWEWSVRANGEQPLRYLAHLSEEISSGRHEVHGDFVERPGLRSAWTALLESRELRRGRASRRHDAVRIPVRMHAMAILAHMQTGCVLDTMLALNLTELMLQGYLLPDEDAALVGLVLCRVARCVGNVRIRAAGPPHAAAPDIHAKKQEPTSAGE